MAPFWKGWSEMVTRGVGSGVPKGRYLRVSLLALASVVAISALARASSTTQTDWTDRRLNALENQNIDARLRVMENDRRLDALNNQNLDGRLRVVESDMFEVKWLTRTVTATLIGQFILAGISLRRKP